ncbi:hypothetical protein MTO96_032726 [Rhipicephalus appendiculatus]
MQDFGAGRFEVTFKTKTVVDRSLADSAKLSFKYSEIQFDFCGHRTTTVRVLGYPADSNDHVLWRGLQSYGKVLDMSVDNAPGYKGISSGNWRVRMLMSQPVPNLFKVDGKTIQCEYDGVVRLCRRCLPPGHFRSKCETPQCTRCDEFGHLRCKAPCKRCGGDHSVALSKQKFSTLAWRSSAPQAVTSAKASAQLDEFPTIADAAKEGQQGIEKQPAPAEVQEKGERESEPAEAPPTVSQKPAPSADNSLQAPGEAEVEKGREGELELAETLPSTSEEASRCDATSPSCKQPDAAALPPPPHRQGAGPAVAAPQMRRESRKGSGSCTGTLKFRANVQ